ncbi:MAG: acetate/propionate family kinase [Proteobacteria bacterium]|nr:acetate/propionate family kinase [Pseudomonadota bacterium]
MTDTILTLNAGSSSIKFAAYAAKDVEGTPSLAGKITGILRSPEFKAVDGQGARLPGNGLDNIDLRATHDELIVRLLEWINGKLGSGNLAAVGHRVVHGGQHFLKPVLLDDTVIQELAKLNSLAPLHQPHNLAAIEVIRNQDQDLPQIACFDTGFHSTQHPLAKQFALPRSLKEDGIIRYGFHGISYDYLSSVLPEHIDEEAEGRFVIGHLGNGASLCAIKNRQSVATTMGFTALDGLMMGRRCGALDVGVVLHLLNDRNMTPKEVEDLLYNKSGLLGVSGLSNNMQDLEKSTDPAAKEAIDLYCYRTASEIGKLIPTLGGLDGIVFSAGIGENSPLVRQKVCNYFQWLGIEIDEALNKKNAPKISAKESRIKVLVVPTDEEVVIARATRKILKDMVL